jgi:hypothetical protein
VALVQDFSATAAKAIAPLLAIESVDRSDANWMNFIV